ncbi:MAG: glycosyltransferase family 9 protein, partial [Candidatus Sumerlaeia bacterium]|nr:glycosyltransferase family 9 protein [Candidatus Sumerlaeia bacterium]
IIGIHTGSGSVFRTKAWTLKGWTELIEELNQLPNTAIILMGGEAEYEFNTQLKTMLDHHRLRIIDAGCQNSLADFIGILNCCDVVVGLDSLAMHLAIALKKKVVAIFGPTCPQEIDLYGNGKIVVAESDCTPCYRQHCDKSPRCMEKLSGRVVARAVYELLSPLRINKSTRLKKRA